MDSDDCAEQLQLLSGLAMLLQSCEKETDLFEVTYWYLPRIFPGTLGKIFLLDKTGEHCAPVFSWPTPGAVRADAVPDHTRCPAMIKGNAVNESDADRSRCLHCRCGDYCIPFRDGRESIGVFCIKKEKKAPLSSHDKGLTWITAEYLSLAVANIRLKNRLKDMATRDPLTGLYNRRYMDDVTIREIKKAKRAGAALGMVMVDLDHFKNFNDTYGHQAGDEVLKSVARGLVGKVRSEDMVCRFGGEEFFVLITGGGYADYMNRAHELRSTIKSMEVSWQGRDIGPLTASFGVAAFPDDGETFDDLLKTADQALYAAKEQGRDRVVRASDLMDDKGL